MWKFLFLLLTFDLVFLGQCQFFGFDASAPDDIYHRHFWNWRENVGDGQLWPPRPQRRDDDGQFENPDREPLGPDYKDPESVADPDNIPQIPDTGVIDVDANGYPSGFPSSFPDIHDNSGFPSYGVSFPGFFNYFSSLRRNKPWWNGPNVCIEREETLEDTEDKKPETDKDSNDDENIEDTILSSINLSSCRETFNKYECITKTSNRGVTKTFTVKYKCCHGYRRTKETPTCTKLDLKSILQTIEDLNALEFRKMITSTDLEKDLNENNFTVFVPTTQALNDFTENMLEMNQVEIDVDPARRKRDLRHALSTKDLTLNHIVKGFIDLTDIDNEDILNSEYNNSTIRVNIYPTSTSEKLITVNCVPVKKANNLAENGVVHVIDGVITPGQFSIREIIEQSKKLNVLKKILQNENLKKLFDRDGPFTFLAPTDEAFDKLDSVTKQKLLRGDDCAVNILQYHIIAHSICSAAINGNVTVHNIEGNLFNLERREDDELIIEDNVKIVKSDIIANNGVIQLVDTLMVPDSALRISQALKKRNLTKFSELIEEAGLSEELDAMNNITLFAPTDEAVKNNELLKNSKDDKEILRKIVKYHTLPGKLQSCEINNNDLVETVDDNQFLRFNLFSTLPLFTNVINRATVNCARLINIDEKSCGSIMHTVDKILVPPEKNVLEIINSNEEYSILSKIIKDTEIEKHLNDSKQLLTFLAPPNQIFDTLDEKDLNILLENKEKANEVLKNHVLTEILCCTGVGPQSWMFNSYVPTLSRNSLEIRRDNRHQVKIGKATVTQCDLAATNGVVHVVNRVMLPSQHQYSIPGFGSLFMFEL